MQQENREIEDLCYFLNDMGAKITGIGTSRLEIEGVEKLFPCEHTIIPDRIVAGTFIIASVMFDGKIEVKGVVKEHLGSFLMKLDEMGVKFDIEGDRLRVLSKLSDLKTCKSNNYASSRICNRPSITYNDFNVFSKWNK